MSDTEMLHGEIQCEIYYSIALAIDLNKMTPVFSAYTWIYSHCEDMTKLRTFGAQNFEIHRL